MKVAGVYSFKRGREEVEKRYPRHLEEIVRVITSIDSSHFKTKVSKEKTMRGRMLFNPVALNAAFKAAFAIKNGESPQK